MVLCVLCSLLCVAHLSQGLDVMRFKKRVWSYEMISLTFTTSDENLFNSNVKLVYISREVYALSGTVNMNFDIAKGDNNMVEEKIYRSATGSSTGYTITPFAVPKMHDITFINLFYKEYGNNGFKNCTNLPKLELPFKPPFKKGIYTIDKCFVTFGNLPYYMLDGYYKAVVIHTGAVNYTFELLGKITYDI